MKELKMPSVDLSLALQNATFFENFTEKEIQTVLSVCTLETWQKGHSILSQNLQNTLYFVVSGHVKSVQINADTGRAFTLFLFEAGDIFDILQLLHNSSSDAILEAHDKVSVLAMPKTAVSDWVDQYPEFNRALLPYLGKMISYLEGMATNLALHDTETRLAHLIVHHLTSESFNGFHLLNNLNHENLAQMIGSVRTVVNRQLQHWRRSGIISTENGKITIEKLEALLQKTNHHFPHIHYEHQKDK